MKLIIKKKSAFKKLYKKPVEEDDETESNDSCFVSSSWALTDPVKMQQAAKAARLTSGGNRAPELWIRDNEAKLLRFRQPEPLASFERYNLKLNGRFMSFIRPASGQPDLFATRLQARPQRVFVYEVVDINGYEDKKGKKQPNQSRFFVVGTRLYEQLRSLAEETGTPLDKMHVKIKRTGQGTNSVYLIFKVDSDPASQATRNAPKLADKFTQFYRPLKLSEQKAIVGSAEVPA